jgi:hypothetical protein
MPTDVEDLDLNRNNAPLDSFAPRCCYKERLSAPPEIETVIEEHAPRDLNPGIERRFNEFRSGTWHSCCVPDTL